MAKRRGPRVGTRTTRGPAPPLEQAKRRPHSGQEIRDGARLDPSKRADPHQQYQPPSRGGLWLDGLVFVAVLTASVLLITVGHLTVAELVTVCTALISLLGAWASFRARPPSAPPKG